MGQDYLRDTRTAPPELRIYQLDPSTHQLPRRPTTDLDIIAAALPTAEANRLNVLAPVACADWLPPDHAVSFRVVIFPLEGPWYNQGGKNSNGIWYETDGGLALHKAALRQIAALGECSYAVSRLDNGRIGSYWAVKATAMMLGLSGRPRMIECSKELDLRDGSPLIASWEAQAKAKGKEAAARISNARADGQRTCETKAVNAALRDMFGIRGSYSEEQANRPFVVPVLIYAPQSAEAWQRSQREAVTAANMIFGSAQRQQPTAIIEAPPVEKTAQRALPDYGSNRTPDFKAEAKRLANRTPVGLRELEEEPPEEDGWDEPPPAAAPPPPAAPPPRAAPAPAAPGPRPEQRRPAMTALPPGGHHQPQGTAPRSAARDQQQPHQQPYRQEQPRGQQRIPQAAPAPSPARSPAPTPAPAPAVCGRDDCRRPVSEDVAAFSRRQNSGKVLCLDHQPRTPAPAPTAERGPRR